MKIAVQYFNRNVHISLVSIKTYINKAVFPELLKYDWGKNILSYKVISL